MDHLHALFLSFRMFRDNGGRPFDDVGKSIFSVIRLIVCGALCIRHKSFWFNYYHWSSSFLVLKHFNWLTNILYNSRSFTLTIPMLEKSTCRAGYFIQFRLILLFWNGRIRYFNGILMKENFNKVVRQSCWTCRFSNPGRTRIQNSPYFPNRWFE